MKLATARRHPRSSLLDPGQFSVLGSFAIVDGAPRDPQYPQIPKPLSGIVMSNAYKVNLTFVQEDARVFVTCKPKGLVV